MKANATENIAAQLQTEAQDRAKTLAKGLFGEVPYGAQKLSKAAFLDMVRRNWSDPNYRQSLLQRIGDESFLTAAYEAGVLPLNPKDWSKVSASL